MKKFNYYLLCSIIICIAFTLPTTASADNKVALIIGNEDYSSLNFSNLTTPVNDAKEMNQKLTKLGFETIVLYNGSREEILDAINRFGKKTQNADVGVFYYSGHATSINYINYLVPCKTSLHPETLIDECVTVKTIQLMMKRNCRLSLLFLDACRNDPRISDDSPTKDIKFPTNIGNKSKDNKPEGLMICYATENGQTASTGHGSLSPFTKSLSKHLYDLGEFRSVWETIKKEVSIISNQNPTSEGSYTNDFYFNPRGIFKPSTNISKMPIQLNVNPSYAKIDFSGTTYDAGQSLIFNIGSSYTYTIKADGYQPQTGKIDVNANSPSVMYFTLKKLENATLKIACENTSALVIWDGDYIGYTPLAINTTVGSHDLKLIATKFYNYESKVDVAPGINRISRRLTRKNPDYWGWNKDWSNGCFNLISYHFSPKYQLGLSFLHCLEDSRFSYGGIISTSLGFYRGWQITQSTSTHIGSNVEVDQSDGQIHTTTTVYGDKEVYSEAIDPYNEAKKYDVNVSLLFNLGYNICTGVVLEAGVGAAYHRDKYYMSDTYKIQKTITTSIITGETIGDPVYKYTKQNKDQWFRQNTKWSPAVRLGTKFFIPLDGFDNYCITLGGGYTYIPINNKFSSWDINTGFLWYF